MKPIRDLRAYGDDLVRRSSPTEGGRVAMRAMAQPPHTPWMRRAVVALTSLAVFSGANVGLALAANPSVPGDPLYGIDRAYERVETALGITASHAAERFDEAAELSNRGRFSDAFSAASEGARGLGQENPGLAHATEVLQQLSADTEDIEPDELPPGLQKQLNDQAKELFGIGKQVSAVANGSDDLDLLTTQLGKHSDRVLAAVREAQQAMWKAKGKVPPGRSGEGPPGQEKKPTP